MFEGYPLHDKTTGGSSIGRAAVKNAFCKHLSGLYFKVVLDPIGLGTNF